jgi:hypothetical protein
MLSNVLKPIIQENLKVGGKFSRFIIMNTYLL